MNAFTHYLIDLLLERFISQQLQLSIDDIFVVAYGGACLGIVRMHAMHFLRRLVDERQEHVKRNTLTL